MKHHLLLFMLICLLGNNVSLKAQSVERGPYLQQVGQESVIIRWRTDNNTSSKVWFGFSSSNLNQSESNNNLTTEHSVKLSGLSPNTKYYYAIGTTSTELAGGDDNHYFKTSPEGSIEETINIWVLGDAGKGGANQRGVRDAFYDFHGDEDIDMTLLLGDNAYNDGTDEEYQDTWFEGMYEDRLINTTMFSCYGNHDGYSANSEDETGAYFEIFDHPDNGQLGGVPSSSEGYYSFDYGDIHVISVNSYDEDLTVNGPQYQWMEEDLQANDKGWTIFICHYPPHDGRNLNSDNGDRNILMREVYGPLLEEYGVDLVLSGHSHSYQRSVLIDGFYEESSEYDPSAHEVDGGDGQLDGNGAYQKQEGEPGTVYMISGSAGGLAGLDDDLIHPAMYSNHMVFGSVRLQITHDQLDAVFITEGGTITDYFTIQKELPPAANSVFRITNPLRDGYSQPQPIIVTNDFTDSLDVLTSVQYYVNGVLESTETIYPFNLNYNIPTEGDYQILAIAQTEAGVEYQDQVSFQVGSSSRCKSVFKNENDAEEKATGFVSTTSSDLEMANDGSDQQVGLRFSSLNIPKGSTIHSANIQFTTNKINNIDPASLTIFGEDSDAPVSYTNTPFSISGRAKTTSSVAWSPPSWNVIGESGANQKTPDISNIIQEIVNRPGYESSSALAFIVSGTGRRTAFSNDNETLNAPVLCLEYTPPYPADSDGDGTDDSDDICFGGLELGAICNDFDPTTYSDTIGPNCNCVGIAYDCPLLLMDIGTLCSDNNPATYDDVVDANCNCTGIPFDCPDFLADIGTPCDDNNENTYNDELQVNCNCLGVPLGPTVVLEIPVMTSSDDAEEKSSGSMRLTSSDLELVDDNGLQSVGIRFSSVTIPSGAVIVDAYLQFTTDSESFIDPCSLMIYGESNANPSTFVDEDGNISSRTKTSESQNWMPAQWTSIGASGSAQRTPSLNNIITEISQQSDYNSGNAMVFIIEGVGRRRASSFDGEPAGAPTLNISYAFPCFDDDFDGICNQDDTCPSSPLVQGEACNDNNELTYNDLVTEDCICVGTLWDCPIIPANFNAPCDDGNPLTYNDQINNNCECAGSLNPFDCQDLFLNIGDACDDNNENTLNDVVDANCNCTGTLYTVETVTISIADPSDDAEQKPSGSVSTSSSDLEMMVDGANVQQVGLRFQNPGIPNGAEIQSAYIQFSCDETNDINPVSISIYGEAHDNPPTFLSATNNISNRIRTNAAVQWTPSQPWFVGEQGLNQRTADLTSIIQELINRPGYSFNNALTILMEGYGRRVAKSFDGDKLEAAKLVVNFGFVCVDDDGDGLCNGMDDCPQSTDNPGTPCNDGDPATFNDVIDENCNCTGIIPTGVACAKINSMTDDAEERASGVVKLASSDLELMLDNSLQTVGLRFTNMNIPAGVTISKAYLQFTVDESVNIDPCMLNIYGEANNNPATFSGVPYSISSRAKTNAVVQWSPDSWSGNGSSGAAQESADLSEVLQELVSRNGYNSNAPIGILMDGIGKRVAMSYDKNPEAAAELCVEWDLSSEPLVGEAGEHDIDETTIASTQATYLEVFPNPARDYLNLLFKTVETDRQISLQVLDVNGKILFNENRYLTKGDDRIRLDDLSLNNGVYFIRVKSEGALLSGQFVIVN